MEVPMEALCSTEALLKPEWNSHESRTESDMDAQCVLHGVPHRSPHVDHLSMENTTKTTMNTTMGITMELSMEAPMQATVQVSMEATRKHDGSLHGCTVLVVWCFHSASMGAFL